MSLDIPIMHDSAQIIGRSLAFHSSAEVMVIDRRNWQIAYRGDLAGARNSLDKLLSGDELVYGQAQAVRGCVINYGEQQASTDISYSADIAPILQQNCLACHVEGGIGPWAMSEYRMVQGFAPMMREVIRTKRIPPWHADPEVGSWHEAAGMSDKDTRTLINWIEAGAPRGDGPDPLSATRAQTAEWPLGEPDLILSIPAFDVPATGVVDYRFPVVENPLDYDAWVVAATVIPGDAKVVHHVLMGSADEAPKKDDKESVFQNYIMGYAPGNESSYMPEGTGVKVPVGGVYLFQMHYTPTGKATIFSLVPHSHYRGRSSTFELVYPDGERELILSVPNYDFNWQRTYKLEQPKDVPAGTRIVHRTIYDNSALNPSNPDPEREVPWGLQSHDEMLYGSVSFSWRNETSSAPTHSLLTADTAQWMGFMDTDMDGKVQKEEMPMKLRVAIGWKYFFLDRNFDGGLDLAEMERLFASLQDD